MDGTDGVMWCENGGKVEKGAGERTARMGRMARMGGVLGMRRIERENGRKIEKGEAKERDWWEGAQKAGEAA